MRRSWNDARNRQKRIDRWLNVPNSNVNDNGKANLDNNDAENDGDGRVLVRIEVLTDTFEPATDLLTRFGELGLKFQGVGVVYEVHFEKCS